MKKFFLKIAGTNGANVFLVLVLVMVVAFEILLVSFDKYFEASLGPRLGILLGSIFGIPLLITWGFWMMRKTYVIYEGSFAKIEDSTLILLKVDRNGKVVAAQKRLWKDWKDHEYDIFPVYLPDATNDQFQTSAYIEQITGNIKLSIRINLHGTYDKVEEFDRQDIYSKLVLHGLHRDVRQWIAEEFVRKAKNSTAVKKILKESDQMTSSDLAHALNSAIPQVPFHEPLKLITVEATLGWVIVQLQ